MAAHSSIHAWRIPWTEEPGGLQSMGSQSKEYLKEGAKSENEQEFPSLLMDGLRAQDESRYIY